MTLQRTIISFAVLFFLLVNFSKAQSVEEAVEAYNQGVEYANNGSLQEAMESFLQCVEICDMIGDEESDATKKNATDLIPSIQFKIATGYLRDSDFENGIPEFKKTIEIAKQYNDEATLTKANEQLPKVYYAYAGDLLRNGNMEEALGNYDKVIELEPDYAKAFLAKAKIYYKQEDAENLKISLLNAIKAAQNSNDRSSETKAVSQGSSYFLKKAVDALGANSTSDAEANAKISLEFDQSQPEAYFILTQAYNKQSKWDDAISAGKKVISMDGVKDDIKAGAYFQIASAYQQKGENDSACENYKNALVEPYTENAKYQMDHILKCTN